MSRFPTTYCSQCGGEFGPGDQGFSHCSDHRGSATTRTLNRTESEVLDLAEDYGQFMWDAGYMDAPTGSELVAEAALKRQEIWVALGNALHDAYAEGRKDEAEENAGAGRLIDAWAATHGKPVPWEKAVEIIAIVNKLPEDERARLLALAEDE